MSYIPASYQNLKKPQNSGRFCNSPPTAEEFEHLHAAKQLFMPITLATFYTDAGDKDRAFYWLEQGYKYRGHALAGLSMVFLNTDPELEPLRSDPRYKDLCRRVGLPP